MATLLKRVQADGSVHYTAQIRLKGQPTATATFDKQADAKKWISATEAEIRAGRYFQAKALETRTVGEVIDRYLREVLPGKPASLITQTQQLGWWKEELGALSLARLTPARLSEAKSKLAAGLTPTGKKRSPATVNRYLSVMSHVLTMASMEWGYLETNPLSKVQKLREPAGRVRFLSAEERKRLLEACRTSNPAMVPIVTLAIYTGMRHGEILSLTWSQVDFAARAVRLEKTKNGERRTVPLAPQLVELLQDWGQTRRADTHLLFPSPVLPHQPLIIEKMFVRACRRAELENFHFHDLRHTAASYLAMSGASLLEISQILGHKTLAMVKRYAHLTEQHTAAVMDRMGQRFGD